MRMLVAALVLALAGPVLADPPAHAGKGRRKGAPGHDDALFALRFSSRDRDLVRGYFVEQYGRGCPPGLAKKNNGCLPPGQAKKRYVVGRALPRTVVLQPLPPVLLARLGAAPAGYRYGIVDGDLVKLAVGTLLVVDAVSGLVD